MNKPDHVTAGVHIRRGWTGHLNIVMQYNAIPSTKCAWPPEGKFCLGTQTTHTLTASQKIVDDKNYLTRPSHCHLYQDDSFFDKER